MGSFGRLGRPNDRGQNRCVYNRQPSALLPIKARGMKALPRVIIDMAAARPLSRADRDAFLRHV